MNAKKYSDYSVEEWVQDGPFRDYILNQDPAHVQFWEDLCSSNDRVAQNIREATEVLLAMNDLYQEYRSEGEGKAKASLEQLEEKIRTGQKRSPRRIIAIMSAAAASIAIAGFVLWFMIPSSLPGRYITMANETQEVLLPDGSLVYLNENSSLSIHDQWEKGNRAVALDGEGYFMVRSQKDSVGRRVKFTVKTAGLNIEVLGTQFNVHTRDTITSIALDEGSVKLIQESLDRNESYMVPGQVASFNQRSKEIRITDKALVDSDVLWKPKIIEFNHIKLSDAIDKMETVFDVHFATNNKEILDLEIDKLSVPSDNPDVFIKTVNILFANKILIEFDPDSGLYDIRELNRTIDQ